MQNHTGEHIISGLVHKYFGYRNVGFHLGKEIVTMEVVTLTIFLLELMLLG